MPSPAPGAIAGRPDRAGWRIVAVVLPALLATIAASGCVGVSSPRVSPPEASIPRAESLSPSPSAKRDEAIVRASGAGPLEQNPAEWTGDPVGDGLSTPTAGQPVAVEPAQAGAGPSPGPSGPINAGQTLYRYDPMRGAALSQTPPPNRNITLRELLGLGRSDIADKDDEVKPDYPDLHDDPLARSPVPPARRNRLLFPALSNLIFEHDDELKDADEARDDMLEKRSNYDVTLPGPDTANFPNSAFTLPKGRAYIETSPATFYGKSRSFASQYNWEFLVRYGLTDDLEFRVFSSGYAATLTHPRTTGFSPLAFDFKYHMWDENLEKHIPAAGLEIYILTPFGSNYFNGGTEPSLGLLFDHTLPFALLYEHNFGLTGLQDTFGESVYEFSYQWALQRQVFKDFAIFTHGFLNSAALPRVPIFQRHIVQAPPSQLVVGGGFLWNWSKRLALFGHYNAGLIGDSPSMLAQLGFAVAL